MTHAYGDNRKGRKFQAILANKTKLQNCKNAKKKKIENASV